MRSWLACPDGWGVVVDLLQASQHVDLTLMTTDFSRLTIPATLTYQWSVISALGAVCAPFPDTAAAPASGPSDPQSLGLNLPDASWGMPTGPATTLQSLGLASEAAQAAQKLSALAAATEHSSAALGNGTAINSSSSSFTSAMVCSGAGSYIQSISFIFSQLPRLPWLVTCSKGEEYLVGWPPGTNSTGASAINTTLASPTCDRREDVDVLATESTHTLTCRVGM